MWNPLSAEKYESPYLSSIKTKARNSLNTTKLMKIIKRKTTKFEK